MASDELKSRPGTFNIQERKVLKLVAEGYKNREIAEDLKISLTAVQRCLKNLMKKLDCPDIPSLLDCALGNGLISVYEILESRFSKLNPEREFAYNHPTTPAGV